jgi:copper oxidase (laccase) domain-containing protein
MDSNINIILNAYDKGLKAGISQAKKEFKDFSSSVNSAVTESNKALSSLGSTISTVISAIALYKIGDFLKDTALASSRFAEMGIAMNVVGENAGYSAQQLAYVDEQMRKTGISMIESRTAVTKLAQAHMDLSLATKFADAAQGAAVIGQMSSSEALDRMITGIQASEVEVLRHIGINVSWEKSYAKVAEQTGRAKESFTEQEKVMIRSNAVLEAATITNNLYLKSMENAGKQLRTLTGRELPDFKVAMGKAFDPAMTDLIAAARTALAEMRIEITKPDVQRALSDLSKSLTKTIIQIGTDIPSAISKLADSIKTVTDIYNSMPAGVVGAAGAGVVGTILFGPQTGAVIGLITLTSSKINQFKKDHPEIFGVEDKKEWFAGPFKIPTQEPANLKSSLPPEKVVPDLKSASSVLSSELDKMKSANQTVLLLLEDAYKKGSISLEKYFADRLAIINQEYDKEAAVLQEIAANDKTPDAKAKTNAKLFELEQAHTRDIVKLNQQKAKDIADYEDALSKSAIDRNKAVTETELEALKNQYDQQIITIDQYVASRTAILNKTFELDKQAISNQLAVEDEIKKRMGLEDQLYILEQKHKKDILDINNELLESEKKTALERSQAIASMYQAMGESSQASYDAQIEILNEQANRYKQLKIDQLVIDKWYQDQVYSIQKQQALTSNDMYEGWKQGYKDLIRDQAKAGQQGYDLFNGIIGDMKTSFSSLIEDAFGGKLKSATDYFQAFAQSITKTWANMISEMIARWIMLSAMKGFASMFGFASGGQIPNMTGMNLVNPSGAAIGFADGGRIPGISPTPTADNIMIRATAGEWVQPVSSVNYYGAQVMEALRQRLIPKDFFNGFHLPNIPAYRPAFGYADGGAVSSQGFSVSVPVSITGTDNARWLSKTLPSEIERTVIRVMREQLS